MLKGRGAGLAFAGLALLVAFGVKAFYSHAGASELAFILAPSCWVAAHLGGIDLVAEPGAGFVSHAHRMVVGPACAGVNFLVVAFLAVHFTSRPTGVPGRARALAVAAAAAYLATILVNGLRIIVAAHLFQIGAIGPLTPERLHRLAGVVIYCLAVVTLCRLLAPGRASPIVPLGCYVGVALGIPLLNGAARGPLFVEHALVVAAVSALVLAGAWVWASQRPVHTTSAPSTSARSGAQ